MVLGVHFFALAVVFRERIHWLGGCHHRFGFHSFRLGCHRRRTADDVARGNSDGQVVGRAMMMMLEV